MINSITTIPNLPEPFPSVPEFWKDPKTGIIVPKQQLDNLKWRADLLQKAENDAGLQNDLLAACKESMLFWINAFVFTFHQQDIDPVTHHPVPALYTHNPFVTWAIQDEFFPELQSAIDTGYDLGVRKSRDMGASWSCNVGFHWYWLFSPDSQLLEMSRTEGYVDQRGNAKCLFWKHDYINSFLPDWMRPPACLPKQRNRTKMHLANELNGCVIDGESTTAHAGSGDRRKAVLLDEFAKVEHGQAMRSATADVTPCRIVNSTPAGAGTEYSRWMNSGQIKVFTMPYYEHPEKGVGRYIHRDEVTGKYEVRSPWFDNERKRRSKQEVAQEILMQDIESGATFFDIENIDKHIAVHGKQPLSRWNINLKKDIANANVFKKIRDKKLDCIELFRKTKGRLSVWCKLIDGRPDQSKTYTFGIDIGKGQGASPSVISIKCDQTGEKIAEWYCNNTPPYEMPRNAVALALWVGGSNPRKLPFFKWEMNGPGWDFGRMLVKIFKYPFYYRQETTGEIGNKKSKKYGWHSNADRKYELLSLYNRVLAHGGYVNPSIPALEEAKLYIELPNRKLEPSCLSGISESDIKSHGDRVIADSLTLGDKSVIKIKKDKRKAPPNSFGGRKEEFLRKKNVEKNRCGSYKKAFDFSRVHA